MALAATPGIFVANSGVLPAYQSEFPYSQFVKWYESAHIPDWMGAKPGAITAAWRYQSLDPDRELPFLVTYRYPDVAAQSAPEFTQVTLNHPSLPEGGPITKFTKFEVLAGSHVETWRSGSTGDARGPLLVTETIQPAANTTKAFTDWYQSTYITELSLMDGWRRTSRFDVGGGKWFALHEFETRAFDENTTKIEGLLGRRSEETKEVERTAKSVNLAIWELVRVYGDSKGAWGLPGTDSIL
ncbi:hypothetical protein QBC39DRAFT_38934 [Podospora conica]|nr:hypothetical protein QBC39DRAFT_38934 [Schizothecium conicum]